MAPGHQPSNGPKKTSVGIGLQTITLFDFRALTYLLTYLSPLLRWGA
jgi:hypothetical protein